MKIAVIGAGASGLMCAISAAIKAKENNINADICIFESRDKAGRKLLATGNGRCNLINKNAGDYYFDKNKFSSYALNRYDVKSNLDFFAKLGLYTRSDEEGRIYPLSNQASSVLDALRFCCEKYGIRIVCDSEVEKVRKTTKGFIVNDNITVDFLVLACGGKAGVKGFNGYELLKQIGHKVTAISPSLTKIEVKEKNLTKQLKGVRQKGVYSLEKNGKIIRREKGEILFTDYGLSGIAVMQLSAYIAHGSDVNNFKIYADFISEMSYEELFEAIKFYVDFNPRGRAENLLSGFVSKKLGESVIKKLGINLNDSFSTLDDKKIKSITAMLKKFPFEITGLKGFDDAQVTAGGADTLFFNPKTMESKKVKGLYCIGELLDVDGLCGGYNLHWAWSSGRLCGESIINELKSRKG